MNNHRQQSTGDDDDGGIVLNGLTSTGTSSETFYGLSGYLGKHQPKLFWGENVLVSQASFTIGIK